MVTVVVEADQVSVPGWVMDLASFRRWAHSDGFPENGRICFLDGEVWVDLSGEQIFSHGAVKTEFTTTLRVLAKAERLGRLWGDGVMLSNVAAGFSCIPDAIFVSFASLQDKVLPVEGTHEGYVELEGSPDMVLEVISRSSVHKDTVVLRQAYWEANVREYWLVDARREPLKFDIFRHGPKGYRATPKKDGWLKSAVFGKSFRLLRQTGPDGHPDYTLEVR